MVSAGYKTSEGKIFPGTKWLVISPLQKKKYIVSGRIMIHDGFGKGNNISKSDNRTIEKCHTNHNALALL